MLPQEQEVGEEKMRCEIRVMIVGAGTGGLCLAHEFKGKPA